MASSEMLERIAVKAADPVVSRGKPDVPLAVLDDVFNAQRWQPWLVEYVLKKMQGRSTISGTPTAATDGAIEVTYLEQDSAGTGIN